MLAIVAPSVTDTVVFAGTMAGIRGSLMREIVIVCPLTVAVTLGVEEFTE